MSNLPPSLLKLLGKKPAPRPQVPINLPSRNEVTCLWADGTGWKETPGKPVKHFKFQW